MKKPATLQDIANALGMHKSTISLALSGKGTIAAETRQRITAAAAAMQYEPNALAQRLAGGHRSAPVCIFCSGLDLGLATEKILRVQRLLSETGYEVSIHICPESPSHSVKSQSAQIKALCRQRPRAIICAVQRIESAVFDELTMYQHNGGTVVCYDLPVPMHCDQIHFDRENNGYQAARLLLEQGHRDIGLGVSLAPVGDKDAANQPHAYRLRGFQRALAEFGVSMRDEWFFENSPYENGGAEMARRFLALNERPTGLCIVNDYVALAFMSEVMRAGVNIPGELSIVGHDDQPVAAYCPVELTSLSQPGDQIAAAVVKLLTARLSDSPPDNMQTKLIRGERILRSSVSAPAH